jgi:DNA-binding response OmpR family regulator
MPSATVLAIEDDAAIRRGIVDALTFAGYQVRTSGRGDEGLELAQTSAYDLLLLDLVLPGGDGLEILRQVRSLRPTQPIIVLTARGEEDDRVRGLRLGADDYVVKPFSVRELLARVEAVLRRTPARPLTLQGVEIPGGQLDFARREIRFSDGQRTELSERESDLLRYLAENAGRAIAREELLASVWGISPQGVTTRTIDMHIARLREKMRDDPTRPAVLVTVRGKGYKFAVPLASDAQS